MNLIDSHCHLDQLNSIKTLKDFKMFLKKITKYKIIHIITVVISIINYYNIKNIIKLYKHLISTTCGIHPLYIHQNNIINYDKLKNIIKHNNQIVAIGETGLDYNNELSKLNKHNQQFHLIKHIQLSKITNKPLVIHCRNAFSDLIKILTYHKPNPGIIHCFNGSLLEAKKLLDLGFYISFTGIITFNNINVLLFNQIINYIPLDRLLIETDSPFLTPSPFRGKENNPTFLIYIAKHLANIKKIKLPTLIRYTTSNSIKIFNLKINH